MNEYKDCVPNEGRLEKEGHGECNDGRSEKTVNTTGKKDKNFNVLHKDGSLADLPKGSYPGQGANEGSVGLGT